MCLWANAGMVILISMSFTAVFAASADEWTKRSIYQVASSTHGQEISQAKIFILRLSPTGSLWETAPPLVVIRARRSTAAETGRELSANWITSRAWALTLFGSPPSSKTLMVQCQATRLITGELRY